MTQPNSPPATAVPAAAEQLVDQLDTALRTLRSLPLPGTRTVPILRGISSGGDFTDPAVNVIQTVGDLLAPIDDPPRVFRYGGDLLFELREEGEAPILVPLRVGTTVERAAGGLLANLILSEQPLKDGTRQFPLPAKALSVLLAAEPLVARLARIDTYARRPIYSLDFVLLGPGYHRVHRVLVHGPVVEPDLSPLPAGERAIDRLPPHLGMLFGGFCFRSDADLANALGWLLTGLLVNHFVACGKAIALIDGNQSGIGKTLYVRVVGVLLDGRDPWLIHYTPDDEELAKRICATLRPGQQTVLGIDNCKLASGQPVSSPALEANSMAAEISLRILGSSTNFVRPNDVLWGLTMNATRTSPDLVSRGLPVRLWYAGRPGDRQFTVADPVAYARRHRVAILGELAGYVERWTQAGRPLGPQTHRCHVWAGVIGGILAANGLPDFLANYTESADEFDAEADDFGRLAATVLAASEGPHVSVTTAATPPAPIDPTRAWPAARWATFFATAGVDASGQARQPGGVSRNIGRWLAARVGRETTVDHNGQTVTATLRTISARANETRYYFELCWNGPADPATPSEPTVTAELPTPLAPSPTSPEQPAPPATDGGNGNGLDW